MYPGIQSYYTASVLGLTYVSVLCLGEDQTSEYSYIQSYTAYVLYYVISELPADEHPAMQLYTRTDYVLSYVSLLSAVENQSS